MGRDAEHRRGTQLAERGLPRLDVEARQDGHPPARQRGHGGEPERAGVVQRRHDQVPVAVPVVEGGVLVGDHLLAPGRVVHADGDALAAPRGARGVGHRPRAGPRGAGLAPRTGGPTSLRGRGHHPVVERPGVDDHVGVRQDERRVGVLDHLAQVASVQVRRQRDLDHAGEHAGQPEREGVLVVAEQRDDAVAGSEAGVVQPAGGPGHRRSVVGQVGHVQAPSPSARPSSVTRSAGVRRMPMTKSPNSANRAEASS